MSSNKTEHEIQKELLEFIRISDGLGPVKLSHLTHTTNQDRELALFYLKPMEKRGWITSIAGPIENSYRITKKGRDVLEDMIVESAKRKLSVNQMNTSITKKNISDMISSLDTLIKIFSSTRTSKNELNDAIDQYNSSWNMAKKYFLNRNEIDLLKIEKVTTAKLLILGAEELTNQREQLVAKAKRLKEIFERFANEQIQINTSDSNISNHNDFEDSDTLLHIEPQQEKIKVDVFISHRFVKSDIKLAATLQKILSERNIEAYLAERQREYGKHLSEKIKENIEKSKCLVAIITENSKIAPSIHQEIGYALGFRIPVVILSEEDEAPGILVKGVETELFKRKDFEKHCKIVFDHIPISSRYFPLNNEEKQALNNKVYAPCYDKITVLLETNLFSRKPFSNPWESISPAWKLKTELDVKSSFEEFTKDFNIWNKMSLDISRDFSYQIQKITEIITPAFESAGLLQSPNSIYLDDRSSMSVLNWVEEFGLILIDPSITNSSILHQKLIEFSINTKNGHEYWLEQFSSKYDLFNYIMKILPALQKKFETTVDINEFYTQKEKLMEMMGGLKHTLEEKLK